MDVPGIIQIALMPVFLLAGMAGFLNVFAARLARASDRVNLLAEELRKYSEVGEAAYTWRVDEFYNLRRAAARRRPQASLTSKFSLAGNVSTSFRWRARPNDGEHSGR